MSYFVVVAVTIVLFTIVSVSLNVVSGYAGQPNIGQGAFFGLGGYLAATLATQHHWSFWTALLAGVAGAGVAGALLGWISLRLHHDFLAIATLGINFVVVALFQHVGFFGGTTGLYGIPLPSIAGHQLGNVGFLIAGLVLLGVAVGISAYVERTWFGASLIALRDDEVAAAASGVPVAAYKIVAFVLSTLVAGAAGVLYAFFLGAITPDTFGFSASISVLAMLVLGGQGTIRGAIVGAVILGALPEIFRFISDYRLLLFGVVLVVTLRFQPQGLVGEGSALERLLGRLRGQRPARAVERGRA